MNTFPNYNYPAHAFNFKSNKPLEFSEYTNLESYISDLLTSKSIEDIKDGLSNVLYWGHYRAGYRDTRVQRFRTKVSADKLEMLQTCINQQNLTPITIKNIKIPEFSGLAFVSKVMMFYDPKQYVTLDKKIMELKDPDCPESPISQISFHSKETSIRITKASQHHYYSWCNLCKSAAQKYFNNERAADAERGFFRMVELKDHDRAKEIIKLMIAN